MSSKKLLDRWLEFKVACGGSWKDFLAVDNAENEERSNAMLARVKEKALERVKNKFEKGESASSVLYSIIINECYEQGLGMYMYKPIHELFMRDTKELTPNQFDYLALNTFLKVLEIKQKAEVKEWDEAYDSSGLYTKMNMTEFMTRVLCDNECVWFETHYTDEFKYKAVNDNQEDIDRLKKDAEKAWKDKANIIDYLTIMEDLTQAMYDEIVALREEIGDE